jgi:hydroxymethylpyrimidine/phosphomethylpyrimidine kinase
VGEQLDSIFMDIRPDAVKIGMLANAQVITVVAQRLMQYQAQNIVLDPVMVSTSGSTLLQDAAVTTLLEELAPLAASLTPNIPEAEVLSGLTLANDADIQKAAKQIANGLGGDISILIKGGHLIDVKNLNQYGEVLVRDLLYTNGEVQWFESKYIDNPNTHGTGCTLSSAIACNLALGYPINTSIQRAKDYLNAALSTNLNLGQGKGPLNHTPYL